MTDQEKLNELKRLRAAADAAISMIENGLEKPMTVSELWCWRRRFGDFDFVLGDFGITRISHRISKNGEING